MKILLILSIVSVFCVNLEAEATPFFRESAAVTLSPYYLYRFGRKCAKLGKNEKTCEKLDGCVWNEAKNKCTKSSFKDLFEERKSKCSVISSKNVCKSMKMCKWKDGECTTTKLLTLYYARKQNERLDEIFDNFQNPMNGETKTDQSKESKSSQGSVTLDEKDIKLLEALTTAERNTPSWAKKGYKSPGLDQKDRDLLNSLYPEGQPTNKAEDSDVLSGEMKDDKGNKGINAPRVSKTTTYDNGLVIEELDDDETIGPQSGSSIDKALGAMGVPNDTDFELSESTDSTPKTRRKQA